MKSYISIVSALDALGAVVTAVGAFAFASQGDAIGALMLGFASGFYAALMFVASLGHVRGNLK